MGQINVPDRNAAIFKTVELEASTTVDGVKLETTFTTDLPASLGDAVAMEGEREIFRRVINAIVIERQGEERRKIAANSGAPGKERVRAKYLSELGL